MEMWGMPSYVPIQQGARGDFIVCGSHFFSIENCDLVRFTHQHVGTHSACLKTNRRRMQKSCALTWHPGNLYIDMITQAKYQNHISLFRSQLQPRINRSAGPQEALQSRLKEALEKETKVLREENSILVQFKLESK